VRVPSRWDIFRTDFGQQAGHGPEGQRPAFIVSADPINQQGRIATVLPFTDAADRELHHFDLLFPAERGTGLWKPSVLQVDMPFTLHMGRLREQLGAIRDQERRSRIEGLLREALSLGASSS
jgi:mRNA-degrading endonuclease toxin of MazEF toxin-antitoxin module